jgi:hypothetical protein
LEGLHSEEANWLSQEGLILLVEVLGQIHSEEGIHRGEESAKQHSGEEGLKILAKNSKPVAWLG